MLKEGQYEFPDGRRIRKPGYRDQYPMVEDFIVDLPKLSDDAVEFYAHYFGWYHDNQMFGSNEEIGVLTDRIAGAAREEWKKRGKWPTPGSKPSRRRSKEVE